jgi:hypothetical protein
LAKGKGNSSGVRRSFQEAMGGGEGLGLGLVLHQCMEWGVGKKLNSCPKQYPYNFFIFN